MDKELKTEIYDIVIMNENSIYDNIDSIINRYANCGIFEVSAITFKEEHYQKQNEYNKNKIFDITIKYSDDETDYIIRYNFIDIFDKIGTYCNGSTKKHMFSIINNYVWEKNFDVINITTFEGNRKVDKFKNGILFYIIRKGE